jgi:hypothetical protein
VSALWIRRAAVVGVVVASAGCAADTTSSPRVAYAPRATVTTTATTLVAGAVPMVLETELPLHAPTAQLVAGTDGREVAQTGFLFRSDWATRRAAVPTPTPHRSPWPTALTLDDPDTATVAIGTTALPDWVVIKTYATVSEPWLTPDAPPIAEIECMRFTEPKCKFTTTGSGFRIHYDARRVFAGSYIVVFGVWHVPLDDQRPGKLDADKVIANWLFHVDSRGEQGALLP